MLRKTSLALLSLAMLASACADDADPAADPDPAGDDGDVDLDDGAVEGAASGDAILEVVGQVPLRGTWMEY
jgi:hypothetical protein